MSAPIYSYQSLAGRSLGEYYEKGSKFFAYAWPVQSEQEVKEGLAGIAEEHPKSRHVCYAYRIGTDGNRYRANDDGEPSGSAGKPILAQIDSAEITNCCIAVVRYFGGVKLGVPGLIYAYKTSAIDSIHNGEIIECELFMHYSLKLDYNKISEAERIIRQLHAEVISRDFTENVAFIIKVLLKNVEDFEIGFADMHMMELDKIEESEQGKEGESKD
jgi:uncharacterized YigZ family protein